MHLMLPHASNVQAVQVRQLLASREDVLPHTCWQSATADVIKVRQLAAGSQVVDMGCVVPVTC
jgi:hypothetical protein